jgi:hypothetical protein
MRSQKDSTRTDGGATALPSDILAKILALSIEEPADLLRCSLVCKGVAARLATSEEAWRRLYSDDSVQLSERDDTGSFQHCYRIRDGHLVKKEEEGDGDGEEPAPLTFAVRKELAVGLATARRLGRVFGNTRTMKEELAFCHFGYADYMPFVMRSRGIKAAFQRAAPEGDENMGPWTEGMSIGSMMEDIREVDGEKKQIPAAADEMERVLTAFRPPVSYATADGSNCDNLVEALYTTIGGVTAGIFIFKAW